MKLSMFNRTIRSQPYRQLFYWLCLNYGLILTLFHSTVWGFGIQIQIQHRNKCNPPLYLQNSNKKIFPESNSIESIEDQWRMLLRSQKLSLNVTAVALKQTTQLVLTGQQTNEAMELLPKIIQSLDQQLQIKNQEMYPVVALTSSLISLSVLMTSPYQDLEKNIDFHKIATQWWNHLQKHSEAFLTTQKPHRLVKILRLALFLGIMDQDKTGTLYSSICQRLVKGDAMARVTSSEITRTILSYSHLHSQHREWKEEEMILIQSYLRRLRKYSVRTELERTSLIQILKAIQKLLQMASQNSLSDLTKELRITYYTLAAQFFKLTETTTEDNPTSPSEAYLLWQVSRDLSLNPEDALRTTIMKRLEANSNYLIQKASLRELALLSDVFLLSTKFKTAQIIRRIGYVLENDPTVLSGEVQPWIISSVLRYAVLVGSNLESPNTSPKTNGLLQILRSTSKVDRSNEHVIVPFQRVLLNLLQRPDFLMKSSADQIANFLWFLHSVRLYHKKAIFALGHRIVDPDVSSHCSPKLACRLLGYFTVVFAFSDQWDDAGSVKERQDLLSRIFAALGEHLLTVNMSVMDISTALHAYGKASFVQDMGVFDHLATLMIEQINGNDEMVTVRQVAQSLWACGKMAGFENTDEDEIEEVTEELPFEKAAIEMARYLGTHYFELTSRDVTQSLWSLGMLQISDPDITRPLIHRAQDLVDDLNTQEIANILLALSRIKSEDFKAIYDLTRRFTGVDEAVAVKPTTQEAANIIYSLGRLNIRDEEVFKYLSAILMENIEETSAQAVANVLWSHRVVHIPPPRELLDRWTIKKLGLVSVQSQFHSGDQL